MSALQLKFVIISWLILSKWIQLKININAEFIRLIKVKTYRLTSNNAFLLAKVITTSQNISDQQTFSILITYWYFFNKHRKKQLHISIVKAYIIIKYIMKVPCQYARETERRAGWVIAKLSFPVLKMLLGMYFHLRLGIYYVVPAGRYCLRAGMQHSLPSWKRQSDPMISSLQNLTLLVILHADK